MCSNGAAYAPREASCKPAVMRIRTQDTRFAAPVLLLLDPRTLRQIDALELGGDLQHFPWVAVRKEHGRAVLYTSEFREVLLPDASLARRGRCASD